MERDFSIKITVAGVLSASNLIARRLVKDDVNAIGELKNMTITKELMASARAEGAVIRFHCWKNSEAKSSRKRRRKESCRWKKQVISKRKKGKQKKKSSKWKMPVLKMPVLENAGTGKCRYWKMTVLEIDSTEG